MADRSCGHGAQQAAPLRGKDGDFERRKGYCAKVVSCVCFLRERFLPEDTSFGGVLLSVLYVCVVWRGEANGLAGKAEFGSVDPPPRLAGGFFVFGHVVVARRDFWAR